MARRPIAICGVVLACAALVAGAPSPAAAVEEVELLPGRTAMPAVAWSPLFLETGSGVDVDLTVDPSGRPWWARFINLWVIARTADGQAESERLKTEKWITAIAAGPDGTIYAAAGRPARIVRPGPQAPLWSVPAGAGAGEVTDLTVGPDGALWYTAVEPDRIGRVVPGQPATEWPTREDLALPSAIAPGPGGMLWAGGRQAIARVDPTTGALTPFPVGDEGRVVDLAAGPDGRMWGAVRRGSHGAIASVAPGGDVRVRVLEERGQPLALAVVGDEVWAAIRGRAEDSLLRLRGEDDATLFAFDWGRDVVSLAARQDRLWAVTVHRSDDPGNVDGYDQEYALGSLSATDLAGVPSYPVDLEVELRLPAWAQRGFSLSKRGFGVPVRASVTRPAWVTPRAHVLVPGGRDLGTRFPRTRWVPDPDQPHQFLTDMTAGHLRRLDEALERYGRLRVVVSVAARDRDGQRVVARRSYVIRR